MSAYEIEIVIMAECEREQKIHYSKKLQSSKIQELGRPARSAVTVVLAEDSRLERWHSASEDQDHSVVNATSGLDPQAESLLAAMLH